MSAKKVEFGQVHEKHNNSMKPRTSIAIALRPSRNEHGGHHYLSLDTGKRILRRKLKELPMPNNIEDAERRQAAASKQAGGNNIH